MGGSSSFLPEPVTTTCLGRRGSPHFRVGVAEVPGYRAEMEDAHCIVLEESGALCGVFDGHAGDTCSSWLAERLPVAFRRAAPQFERLPPQTIVDLCLALDSEYICERYVPPGGSTAAFLLASVSSPASSEAGFACQLQVCNVGDSRVLIGRAGHCLFATKDHKPDLPMERARIEAAGGTVDIGRVDGKLALSRAFGDPDWKDNHGRPVLEQKVIACPDVEDLDVVAGDYAVIACDGMFEASVTSEEVVRVAGELLSHLDDCALVAASLCKLALDRGSQDNVSVMVIQFGIDGRDVAAASGANEFVPGPYRVYDDGAYFDSYNAAARHAQLTVAAAYEMRYDLIRRALAGEETLLRYVAGPSPTATLNRELAKYGPGPPPDAPGPARTDWFLNHLTVMCRETR